MHCGNRQVLKRREIININHREPTVGSLRVRSANHNSNISDRKKKDSAVRKTGLGESSQAIDTQYR